MFFKKYWIRGRWLIIFAVLAVAFEIYIVVVSNVNRPTTAAQKTILEKQASQLSHPLGVQQVMTGSANSLASAFVTQVFSSPLSFDDLSQYYSAEFEELGFTFAKTNIRNVPDMNKVTASVSFCKGDYTAILRYKGVTHTRDSQTDEWTYSIDLRWRSRGCDPE